jgi:hypothetical protein
MAPKMRNCVCECRAEKRLSRYFQRKATRPDFAPVLPETSNAVVLHRRSLPPVTLRAQGQSLLQDPWHESPGPR